MTFSAYNYPMKKKFWADKDRIFFVGIGGVSMSGLASYLQKLGFSVSGSDVAATSVTAKLEGAGITVFYGHRAENVEGADAVVCNSAIAPENPELVSARERGIPVYGRAELLSLVASGFEKTVAVAGCHGKTTAAAMCAHVLEECSGSCTAHIGGEDFDYGNFYCGGEKYFVTEACEYKGNFLKLRPDVAVVLNTDKDHLECYGSEENLKEAYAEFARGADACVVCGEDEIARRVRPSLTYGLAPKFDVAAANIRSNGGKYSFSLQICGEIFDKVRLNVYGKHNIYNALAAAAVAEYYGYPPAFTAEGLKKFRGIRRRFERIGRLNGAEMIADYAHHPREIAAALQTVREICAGKLYVIFQPHTYSRTKLLFGEFVKTLEGVENLVVYKTYPAREYFDAQGSALTLSESLPNSLYIESVRELSIYLRCSLSPGDVAIFLGAGDIYFAAKQVLLEVSG